MKVLNWARLSPDGESYHAVCVSLPSRKSFELHGHEFAEIFIIEKGSLTHIANGMALPMGKGSIALIRPGDSHEVRSGEEGFSYSNIAFPAHILEDLRTRHFQGSKSFWGGDAPVPAKLTVDKSCLERIAAAAKTLAKLPRSRFNIERFLMNVLFEIDPSLAGEGAAGPLVAPDWLKALCEEMAKPKNLRLGSEALFKLAGRCKEHVCRSFKTHLGMTATEYVNSLRLQRAESLLLMTDMKLPELARECGFRNLGRFHTLFKARKGMTPRRYRLARRSEIV